MNDKNNFAALSLSAIALVLWLILTGCGHVWKQETFYMITEPIVYDHIVKPLLPDADDDLVNINEHADDDYDLEE